MDSSTSEAPPLLTLLPDAANPPSRADLLSIKLRLAALLPPDSGQLYWTALVDFVTGKINRQELGQVMERVLGLNGEALQLHNALILSVLYNTTRPSLPPSSIRHSGWHKRKRDKDGQSLYDRDPKRRRIKEQIMALGKRERAEIKSFANAKKAAGLEKEREKLDAKLHSLSASLDSKDAKVGAEGLPLALAEAKAAPEALLQEYMRCVQAPLCCESKLLPDPASLKDRMSLIAYDSGLVGGADNKAAVLGVQALELHLKTMITSVISLVRSNRANGIATTSRAQVVANLTSSLANLTSSTRPLPTTFSPALGQAQPKIVVSSNESIDAITVSPEEMDTNDQGDEDHVDADSASQPEAPLSVSDFASLFEISPHLLVLPHVGAVERLYATGSPRESDYSDCSSSSDEDDGEVPERVGAVGGLTTIGSGGNEDGKFAGTGSVQPITRSRSGTRSSRSASGRSNNAPPAGEGRKQYVIDPSAIVIPVGHPDVVHSPSAYNTSFSSSTNHSHSTTNSTSASAPNPLHPPLPSGSNPSSSSSVVGMGLESRSASGSRRPSIPSSLRNGNGNGNENGTTAKSNSTSALSPKSLALSHQLFPEHDTGASQTRIKTETSVAVAPSEPGNDTSTDGGSESDEASLQPRGRGRIPNAAKNRKLFDVVDSRRLLDGVLTVTGK